MNYLGVLSNEIRENGSRNMREIIKKTIQNLDYKDQIKKCLTPSCIVIVLFANYLLFRCFDTNLKEKSFTIKKSKNYLKNICNSIVIAKF